MDLLTNWAGETWKILAESAPWILAGFGVAGLIHAFLPSERILSHLGKPGWGAVLKASLIGAPLPLCSCSVIPVASSLRLRGASPGATASFMISTPETGIDSIAISYALLGPFLMLARPVGALISAAVTGGLINAVRFTAGANPIRNDDAGADSTSVRTSSCADAECGNGCGSVTQRVEDGSRWKRLIGGERFAFVDMFADLSHWLVIGFAVSGLVSAAVPDGWFEAHLGGGMGTMLLMVVFGLPLYICATSSTPVAAVLIAKGLSPGAALVFLLVGPATNLATMGAVARILGGANLLLYLVGIIGVGVAFGIGTDSLLASTPVLRAPTQGAHTLPIWVTASCAVVLAALLLNGLRVRFLKKRGAGA